MAKLSRPYDDIQNRYVKKMLDDLKLEQEALRTEMGLGGSTDEMPTTGGRGLFGPAEFKYGGKKKFKHSGEEETSFLVKPKSMLAWEDETPTYNIPAIQPSIVDNRYNAPIGSATVKPLPEIKASTMGNSGETVTPKQKFDWGEAGVLGAQLAGDVAGLAYSLRKPNYAKYQRISPELVNYNQAATDITNSAGLMEQSAAGALRNQGQSSGAYLNNRINLASRLGQQTGAQLAELRMNEANTNVGIKNEAKTRNAEIQRAEIETNAREKDSKWQALVGHLGGIGSKVAGYSKDKNQMKLDKAQFAQLLKYSPDLFRCFDPIENSDGTITLKQKGTQTT